MSTEYFTAKHDAGKTVFFRFYDPTQDKLFDFNDDTWQASPTTQALAATEKTAFGDADESLYVASLDLADLYNSAAHRGLIVQSVDDLATDEIIGEEPFFVSNGDLVAPNANRIGVPVSLDGGAATVAGMQIKMADDNGGATFNAGTDSLAELQTAIAIGFPQPITSSAGNITTGTQTSGTHASTVLDDGVYWQIAGAAAAGGFGVNVDQTFAVGTDLKANTLHINAKETLVGVVNVWLWNYLTSAYEQVSDPGHTSISGSSDVDYTYIMHPQHQQASDGEVKVRFTSTDTSTNKYLYLDRVYVAAIAVSELTADEIAQAVWEANLDVIHGIFVSSAGHILHDLFALKTTVATGDTTTSFTLTDGVAVNNAHLHNVITVEDETDGNHETRRIVSYTSGRVVTVDEPFSFTPAPDDNCKISGVSYSSISVDQIDTDAVDAAALKADAVTKIVAGVFAKTGITAVGTASFNDIIKRLNANARGKIARAGITHSYKDDDDTTEVFSNDITDDDRTPT